MPFWRTYVPNLAGERRWRGAVVSGPPFNSQHIRCAIPLRQIAARVQLIMQKLIVICLYSSVGNGVRASNGDGDQDERRGAMVENLRFVATPSEATTPSWIQSDGGLELTRCAFPLLDHKFSVRRNELLSMLDSGDTSTVCISRGARCSPNLLKHQPVDLLVIELGAQTMPTVNFDNGQERWECLVDSALRNKQPKVVVEAWSGAAILWRNGPASQGYIARWKARGYST
jgi:hypothetical protein